VTVPDLAAFRRMEQYLTTLIVYARECPYCHAAKWRGCVTSTGRPASPHKARIEASA
jgi:hypothetical protein